MDSIETRQRIKYLLEHGGVWEQARDKNERWHKVIVGAVSLTFALELFTLIYDHLLR